MIDLSHIDGTTRVQVNEWNRSLDSWRKVMAELKAEGKSCVTLRAKIVRDLRKNGHLDEPV